MAQNITVKPEYVNNVQVFVDGKTVLLNNSLTQDQLLAIYLKQEFRPFFNITFSNVQDSFPENFPIDPSLFNAYDSGQITHDQAATYLAGTLGKALNDARKSNDNFQAGFVKGSTKPALLWDWANSKIWNNLIPFSRNSIGTFIDKNGYIKIAKANKPRFTHDSATLESLGLLLESQKINLLTYSELFSDASWIKSNGASVALNASVLSPSGIKNTAFDLTDGSVANVALISKSATLVDSTAHTFSVFAKAGTIGAGFKIQVVSTADNTNGVENTFDVGIGSKSVAVAFGSGFTVVDTQIKPYKNGWFRTELSFSSQVTAVMVKIIPQGGSHTAPAGQYVTIWGTQLAKGDSATSYIPTAATTVTREMDIININSTLFADLFPTLAEGTLYLNARKAKPNGGYTGYYAFTGANTAGGRNDIRLNDHPTDESVFPVLFNDGVLQYGGSAFGVFSVAKGTRFQNAFAWKKNDAKIYQNGEALGDDFVITVPGNIDTLVIDGTGNITIAQFVFWSIRLTNAELLAMTKQTSIVGKNNEQLPAVSELGKCAFTTPEAIWRGNSKQFFCFDGTGASITRNIRLNFDFYFEVVDSSGVNVTAMPSSSSVIAANTDNPLTITAPQGKTFMYAITPVFDNN